MSVTTATDAMRVNRNARSLSMQPITYRPELLPPPADTAIEMKEDGIPLLWTPSWGRTREGVDFDATRHLWQGLGAINAHLGGNHLLHGEYVNAKGFEATLGDFRRGGGAGCILVFDAVPLDVWNGFAPSPTLRERRARLERAFAAVRRDSRPGVGIMEQRSGITAELVELSAGFAWEDGLEGVVVKDLRSPYVREHSEAWLKVKRQETADVRVRSVELRPGTAILSAVIADFEGRDVRIGVGFSEGQRARPGDFAPGVVIEVKHLGRTSKGSLRSATFLRIRGDKA